MMNIPRKFTGNFRLDHICSFTDVNPVHPPIKDQNLLDRCLLQNSLRRDSYVVEEAETHGFIRLRVMTRWTDNRHGSFTPPVRNGHRGLNGGPAAEPNRRGSFVVYEQ